jgi:DNA-binding NarL/FixJ family response regulator
VAADGAESRVGTALANVLRMALARVLPPDARSIPVESANGLSRHQQQVLTLAAQGLSLKRIGYELGRATRDSIGEHVRRSTAYQMKMADGRGPP